MRASSTSTSYAMCEITAARPSKRRVRLHRSATTRPIACLFLPGGGVFIDRLYAMVDGSTPTMRTVPRRRGSSTFLSLPGGGVFIDWLDARVDGSTPTMRAVPRRRASSSPKLCERGIQ